MTDEDVYDLIVYYMQKGDVDKIHNLSQISKEHKAAYDIQNFFIQTSYDMKDIYSSPYYQYSISCDKGSTKRIYSKNEGISGFYCHYVYSRYQVIFLQNDKTSKSICIHESTPNTEQFLSCKTYIKILDVVRYILRD